jgi:uncharacterized membrane protein YkvA (DUF1232 family)
MPDKDNYEKGSEKYEKEAEEYLNDKEKSKNLLQKAVDKARENEGALGEAMKKLELLFEMFRAWIKGDYKEIPKKSILMVIAAIIYFVSPIDLIPDFIVGLGFFDDAAVIGYTIKQISKDLDRFQEWKEEQAS